MKLKPVLLLIILFSIFSSCEKIDNSRIPAMPVNIALDNTGLWNTYGVSGYGEYHNFIKSMRIPTNFSYTALSSTGYGGVLLISGYDAVSGSYNMPLAYDLACPVEASMDVRVSINKELEAVCPKCGSRYNVCEGQGTPIFGEALERRLGLKQYHAYPASMGGYIIGR